MIDTDKYEGHTPEAWSVDEDDPYRVIDVQECTIARTDFIDIEEERSWQLVNAQLIADAPLLLERVIHLEHILKCAKDVLTNIYTYDKDLEDAEWIAWFCDMEDEEE
jgi:hypothetical protein